jgi:hypothetical protein
VRWRDWCDIYIRIASRILNVERLQGRENQSGRYRLWNFRCVRLIYVGNPIILRTLTTYTKKRCDLQGANHERLRWSYKNFSIQPVALIPPFRTTVVSGQPDGKQPPLIERKTNGYAGSQARKGLTLVAPGD